MHAFSLNVRLKIKLWDFVIILQILRKVVNYFLESILFIVRSGRMKIISLFWHNVQQTRGWSFEGQKSKIVFYGNVFVDEVAFLCYILRDVFGSILDFFSAICGLSGTLTNMNSGSNLT